jgi:hypothetical protein
MKASDYLGKFDLDSPYLKTLEIYSLTKTGKPSKKSSFKLPSQGIMKSNGQLFRQKIWEPVTSVKESGSLPTPTAMDHLPQRGYESMVKQTQVHRKGRTKLANLREAVNPQTVELFNTLQNGETLNIDLTQTGEDMLLNPHFVEEMMGYPIGYLV